MNTFEAQYRSIWTHLDLFRIISDPFRTPFGPHLVHFRPNWTNLDPCSVRKIYDVSQILREFDFENFSGTVFRSQCGNYRNFEKATSFLDRIAFTKFFKTEVYERAIKLCQNQFHVKSDKQKIRNQSSELAVIDFTYFSEFRPIQFFETIFSFFDVIRE